MEALIGRYHLVPVGPGGSTVKNPPAIQELQETQVGSLGREDPLEEGIATHSGILAWTIPWTEEPDRLQSMGLQKSWTQLRQLSKHTCIGLLVTFVPTILHLRDLFHSFFRILTTMYVHKNRLCVLLPHSLSPGTDT